MRLIDADALKKDIETEWLTPQTKMAFFKIIDNAQAVTPSLPTEVKKALEVLEAMQQGMKRGKWIPVSERLPEYEGTFLVTDIEGKIYIEDFRFQICDRTKSYWSGMKVVIAWQELPKPYKEGGAE